MKFATILREAGFSVKHFEKCGNIPIVLYDGKDRIEQNEDVRYLNPLFSSNSSSFIDFHEYLKNLEKNPPESINVKIDESSVILFYNTPDKVRIFPRYFKKDPIDYMD